MSDKNVVKTSSLRFDPPNSAGALYQFLSRHSNEAGVKLEGAYVAPVIKVRDGEPKKIDTQSRDAWSFYLLNMQQALAGTERAQTARDVINSLMATEKLKLSVGKLLGPVRHLMEAEQERLRSANSYVKRWIANERLVLEIAVPHDPDEQYLKKEVRDREALQTVCSVLSRFTNCADGDIDTEKIRDEAYAIGHNLPKDEIDALGSARMSLPSKLNALNLYIGPEVPLLINLCIAAHGKSEKEFRMDTDTKTGVLNIMRILKARTDIDEYHTPTPPGTVADRKARRSSMPVFAAFETTASATSTSTIAAATTATTTSTSTASTTPRHVTPEKDSARIDTTPPSKSPPPTPRRGSPGSEQNGPFLPASVPMSASAGSAAHGRNAGRGMDMGAAIAELKSRQTEEPGTDSAAKAELDSVPVTPRKTQRDSSSANSGASSVAGSSVGSTRSPKTPNGRKRLDEASRSDAIRQKSDGDDSSIQQPRKIKPAKRRIKSMESRSPDASDQKEMDMARKAARALKAELLKPLTDTVTYKKWEAAEQQLKDVLTPEMSKAVGRLMAHCHQVDLEHGRERPSLDRVIKTLRPQVRETRAFVAVRDLLLAESRGETSTKAAAAFPELLSLLVFAIDAERAWRQEHDAKASH